MNDVLKLARIQVLIILLFVAFKLIRKSVLEHEPAELIQVFLYSFPNFCEGVVGVLSLTMLGLYSNRWLRFSNQTIYLLAVFLAAVYVITQELKVHNLGGANIYDPNDLIFSGIGLLTGAILIFRLQPQWENPVD